MINQITMRNLVLLAWILGSVHASGQSFQATRILEVPDLAFTGRVYTGLDILEQMDFKPLKQKTIAVLCNRSAVNRNGRHLLEILKDYPDINVAILFTPEYGLFTSDDKRLKILGDKEIDPTHGARIVDLFGRYIQPPNWSLKGIETILVDIQDTGVRYSTYITTLTKIMEAASHKEIPVYVLDRPNPLRGDRVEGPVIRPQYQSFEGYHLVSIRHGLTFGEYALIANEMGWTRDLARVDLTVVPLSNWKRRMWYDETGLTWIPVGPDLHNLETLLAYTGMALIRGTNLNGGQGTDHPYLRVGAPWLSGQHLAEKLRDLKLPGVQFKVIRYTPYGPPELKTVPRYAGQECSGVELVITDRDRFNPLNTATAIIILTHHLYPNEFQWVGDNYVDRLFGTDQLRTFTAQRKPPDYLPPLWMHDVIRFNEFRQNFLLYD